MMSALKLSVCIDLPVHTSKVHFHQEVATSNFKVLSARGINSSGMTMRFRGMFQIAGGKGKYFVTGLYGQ